MAIDSYVSYPPEFLRRSTKVWFGFVLIFLGFFFFGACDSAYGLSEAYQQLQEELKKNETVDSSVVRSLPEPTTPGEYHLRSRVRKTIEPALRDLRRALEMDTSIDESLFVDWMNLSLLADPSEKRFRRLKSFLNRKEGDLAPRVWLLAGKYAGYMNRYSRAIRWTRNALGEEETRATALLDLSNYSLKRQEWEQAHRFLERYLLETEEKTKPRFWLLMGQYFQGTGSDSRAYLTYNHVIRNYPSSLELAEAKRRIDDLPEPEVPRSETDLLSKFVRSESDYSGTRDEPSGRGDWKVQVGSFRSRKRALSYRRRMNKRLSPSRPLAINQAMIKGTKYFRVQLTGFKKKDEARRRKETLERRGVDAFVLNGSS